jgi:hypothetical protein
VVGADVDGLVGEAVGALVVGSFGRSVTGEPVVVGAFACGEVGTDPPAEVVGRAPESSLAAPGSPAAASLASRGFVASADGDTVDSGTTNPPKGVSLTDGDAACEARSATPNRSTGSVVNASEASTPSPSPVGAVAARATAAATPVITTRRVPSRARAAVTIGRL